MCISVLEKGGKMKNGPYNLIIAPENYPGKKYRSRYAYEHIIIYWKVHGIIPKKGFEIHHIDGNHRNNKLENLRLVTNKEHHELHRRPISFISKQCGYCRKELLIEKRQSHGRKSFFCSRKHQHFSMTKKFRDSSAAEQLPVKEKVAGAIPAPGAK